MIDGNATDFIDKLSYEDHYALFQGKKYFFNGCQVQTDTNGKIQNVRLEVYDLTNNTTIFSIVSFSIEECIKSFEEAPIWNGKSFWEVEQEMQWVDE